MPRSEYLPTESQEQRALFCWAAYQQPRHPELRLMYHVPNEGKRTGATGARMRAEGLRPGVPDICLPVARGGYHALYIELKRLRGGRLSEDQRAWLSALSTAGNKAVVCRGWEAARKEIERYLEEA